MAYGTWNTARLALGSIVNQHTGAVTNANNTTSIGAITRNGFVTPGFGSFRRLNRGNPTGLPINSFSFTLNVWYPHFGDYYVEFSNPVDNQHYTGAAASLLIGTVDNCAEPTPGEASSCNNVAIQKLLDSIKGQKVNVAQVYAERKMTADLIGSSAVRIANSFMQLRKGDIKEAFRALKSTVSRDKAKKFNSEYAQRRGGNAIASAWLEGVYGWTPLLQDIIGSAEWLASKQVEEIRVTAKAHKKLLHDTTSVRSGLIGKQISQSTYVYDISYGVWFKSSGAALASVIESGILNPATIAWELTPWSFVVDWFIPIGNYINTLDATIGLTFSKGYKTTFLNAFIVEQSFAQKSAYGGRTYTGYSRSSRNHSSTFRVPLTGFPQMEFPSFKNPLSFQHAANAVALLTQAFVNRKV